MCIRDSWPLEPGPSLYINYEAEKLLGRPAVGEALALRLNGRDDLAAQLVGISLRPFDALAYMPLADFERATGQRGRAGRVVVYLEEDAHAKAPRSEGAKEEKQTFVPWRLGSLAPSRERLPLDKQQPAPLARAPPWPAQSRPGACRPGRRTGAG